MVRIVVTSDTHNKHNDIQVPEADVFVHCGDATISSTRNEMEGFARWINHLPHRVKLFCGGNHDWELFNYKHEQFISLFDSSVDYITVGSVEVAGVKIFGCGMPGAWEAIPTGVDVLFTHYPCLDILDEIPAFSKFNKSAHIVNAGNRALYHEVTSRIKPRYHLAGHIHEDGGKQKDLFYGDGTKTTFINAAMLDENYQLARQPIVFDIENE